MDLGRRQRLAEIVTLDDVAAHRNEVFVLTAGFDAFRHDLHAQRVRQIHDRTHHGGILFALIHIPHQAAIDLQPIETKIRKVGEIGVAGTEVVHG